MHRRLSCFCLMASCAALFAQAPARAGLSAPPTAQELPVRKVVLYKNGVGYFEHAGQVTGNQKVGIDFTSSQLNDVLQSLTVLDGGGGRVGGVNYNSTTPLAEQLKALSLGMGEDPNSVELFQALRGQQVEVVGAPGGSIAGRLMSIETRTERVGGAESGATVDKFFLTVVASSGAARVVELAPSLSVRPLNAALKEELDRYLELLASSRSNGLRHLTLEALGQGTRDLRVSYISEVPVWKATYRLVFAPVAKGTATLQGWAVVDNTVGADWNNVQLSLVAGAPQSFIQPISEPLYVSRPKIAIATVAQTAPTTHDEANAAALAPQVKSANVQAAPARSIKMVAEKEALPGGHGVGAGYYIGTSSYSNSSAGVDRVSDAMREGDVATKSFDDNFEYALTQPVTIAKNQSAMVPILQQELPTEHITLWSPRQPRPLRAVWIENKSKLTLDAGSFSIFESGTFAGEGLMETFHPGQKQLLSYATDQAVRVASESGPNRHALRHVKIEKGAVVESYLDTASATYTVSNSADVERVVMIEHARRGSQWMLDDGVVAAETTPELYRFKLTVLPHATAKLEVREHGPQSTTARLNPAGTPSTYLADLVRRVPDAAAQLQPAIAAAGKLAEIDQKIRELQTIESEAGQDQGRARENLQALKGNDAAKRYVDELNRAEDRLQTVRRQRQELEQQKKPATEAFQAAVSVLSLDWDVKAEAAPFR